MIDIDKIYIPDGWITLGRALERFAKQADVDQWERAKAAGTASRIRVMRASADDLRKHLCDGTVIAQLATGSELLTLPASYWNFEHATDALAGALRCYGWNSIRSPAKFFSNGPFIHEWRGQIILEEAALCSVPRGDDAPSVRLPSVAASEASTPASGARCTDEPKGQKNSKPTKRPSRRDDEKLRRGREQVLEAFRRKFQRRREALLPPSEQCAIALLDELDTDDLGFGKEVIRHIILGVDPITKRLRLRGPFYKDLTADQPS